MTTFGYAGKILRVDLSSGSISEIHTSDYADSFLGGRGIAAKIYWDEVLPKVNAFDAANRLIFATGPLCGLPVIGGSRWTVCGKSPMTEQFTYCNLGGRWGAELKFAGYDAIVVQGKSHNPVYLFINGETAELRDASTFWGQGSIDTREMLKSELGGSVRVVAIGPAGENTAVMASLLADNDASGRGGLGASMGAKRLKAIAVQGAGVKIEIAQPERWQELIKYYRGLRSPHEVYMSRFSKKEKFVRAVPHQQMKREPCYGCDPRFGICGRRTYEAADGSKGKFICHSAFFYQPRAEEYYGEWNDVPFKATRLCDNYGLDTIDIDLIMSWLEGCYKASILNDKNTGIPLSKIGSIEFIEALVKSVALRDGFGDILAQGLIKAASIVGQGAEEQVEKVGLIAEPYSAHGYDPRLYIITGLMHAMEPRMPIQQLHEVGLLIANWMHSTLMSGVVSIDVLRGIARKFLGGEMAVDFSTYEGKALAAKRIQDREYAKECLVVCDFLWPIMTKAMPDYTGDPSLESKLLSAATGKEVDEEGLNRIGERVFNLQRAILVREGHRGRDFDRLPEYLHTVPFEYEVSNPDGLVPGKEGKPISRKGAVVDRKEFERMKDEYYGLRGWDVATGLQTRASLESLGLKDVADDLEQRELLAAALT